MIAPVFIRQLASVALPYGRRDGVFLMLKAYFDDAGTHAGAPLVVMGGLIGTVDQWDILEKSWGERLADPLPEVGKPPLSMFHMAACEAADGEFKYYKPAERMLVAQHFRNIIAPLNLVSTASAVDVGAWDELVKGDVREFLGPALEVAFVNCLDRVREYASEHAEGRKVAVVFDQGIENVRLHKVIDLYKTYSQHNVEFISITFGKVREFYPLQAADIVATQQCWSAQNYCGIRQSGKDVDVAFREKFKDKLFEGLIFRRQEIEQELRRRGPDGRLLSDNFCEFRVVR